MKIALRTGRTWSAPGPINRLNMWRAARQTFIKNPNYWGVDEKFGNRLPYIDELSSVLIPEESARIAALRTGRIDFIGNPGDAQINNLDAIESLMKSNPELEFHSVLMFT